MLRRHWILLACLLFPLVCISAEDEPPSPEPAVSENEQDDAIHDAPIDLSAYPQLPEDQPLKKEDALALFHHAVALVEGSFDDEDRKQGFTYLQQLAKKDIDAAQYYLGKLYYTGNQAPKDVTQAIHWYKKASAFGNKDAQYAMAWLYYHGEGVTKDPVAAYKWFARAQTHGHEKAKTAKQFVYAQMDKDQQLKIEDPETKQVAKK